MILLDTEEILLGSNARPMHILSLFSHKLKKISLWKSFDLDYVLKQGDKIFKNAYEELEELPLNFPLGGTNVSAGRYADESLLFAKKNNLFENYRHYSETNRWYVAIFTFGGYSVATI